MKVFMLKLNLQFSLHPFYSLRWLEIEVEYFRGRGDLEKESPVYTLTKIQIRLGML